MTGSCDENSYKSILKGSSIFGGVQLFQIIIALVRGKFVAMFLGPAGMGISALFVNSAAAVQKMASLGLNLAIVKEVASVKDDQERLSTIFTAARWLVYSTAIFGMLLCVLLSRWLSGVTFGNSDHVIEFVILGVMMFFTIAGAGQMSFLQGMHQVKRLSMATVIGSLCGLFIGVPLYYFFGDKGIVPAMVVLSLATYLFYTWSVRKTLRGGKISFVWSLHKPIIKKMILLGLVLMASDLIGTVCSYIISAFIRYYGDLDAVGFYQAANSLTGQYAAVIFSAMALDYLPRLSAVSENNSRLNEVVNRQMVVVAYIITPIVSALILFAPVVIRVLLTESFEVIIPLLRWMGLGVLIKALMYPLGYVAFAKDNKKVFFWLEGVFGNLLTLALSLAFFRYLGLIGLGYAVVVDSVICFAVYYFVNRRLYGCRFGRHAVKCVCYALVFGLSVFACSYIPCDSLSVVAMSVVTAISLTVSFICIRRIWKYR